MKYVYYEASKDTGNSIFAQRQIQYSGRVHFHRAFEVAYIQSGTAHYSIEDIRFAARQHDIVFAHCQYRHQSLDTLPNVKYVIAVPEKLTKDISSFFEKNTLPPLLEDKVFNKTLLPLFEKLIKDAPNMSKMLTKGYANLIFGTLAQHYSSISVKPIHKSVSLIADILDYIDIHCTEPITLESISAYFCYNKAYFSRVFNHHIGMSLNNYVNMVRYDKFKKLHQQHPGKSITDLIFSCGFTSAATFYRVHKFRTSNNERGNIL